MLTDLEYEMLTKISIQSKISFSQLIRDSLVFYSMYYKDDTNVCSLDV